MPKTQSKRRDRDARLHATWESLADSLFETMGLGRERVKQAQQQLVGRIVLPGDPEYDQDRLLSNPVFSPSPAMIVFCETESDVAVALTLASEAVAPFTVRSGGHCTAGFSGGFGVMIDVKGLDSVVVDKANMIVTAGTGTDFGTLDHELALYGVHTPGGECSDVCVGGFVQGGGLGFTSATFGMNCDNALALRVMLGDGSVVIASAGQNRDLWWAMRGGTGGNFGVLLSVVYRVYELGDVTGLAMAWTLQNDDELNRVLDVLELLDRDYFANPELSHQLNLQVLIVYQTKLHKDDPPSAEPFCVFMVRALWVGNEADARAAVASLYAMPGMVEQFATVGNYWDVLQDLLANPEDQPIIPPGAGMPNEGKASRYVERALSRDEWMTILAYFVSETPNTMSYMYLEVYGGVIATRPVGFNAFVHRSVRYDAVLDVFWYTPAERAASETFLNGWIHVLEQVWNGQVYQNYPSINVPNYASNYWAGSTRTLSLVKRKYDPSTEFTFAQQVPVDIGTDDELPDLVSEALPKAIDYSNGIPPGR